jgi:hypothetical protein
MNHRLSIEEALGFSPEILEGSNFSIQRVSVDMEALLQVYSRWCGLARVRAPRLLGITIAPGEESRVQLHLVLDLGGVGPFLCLEADLPRDRVLPDFSLVWRYAAWWQEELSVFYGLRFDGKKIPEEISWRLA